MRPALPQPGPVKVANLNALRKTTTGAGAKPITARECPCRDHARVMACARARRSCDCRDLPRAPRAPPTALLTRPPPLSPPAASAGIAQPVNARLNLKGAVAKPRIMAVLGASGDVQGYDDVDVGALGMYSNETSWGDSMVKSDSLMAKLDSGNFPNWSASEAGERRVTSGDRSGDTRPPPGASHIDSHAYPALGSGGEDRRFPAAFSGGGGGYDRGAGGGRGGPGAGVYGQGGPQPGPQGSFRDAYGHNRRDAGPAFVRGGVRDPRELQQGGAEWGGRGGPVGMQQGGDGRQWDRLRGPAGPVPAPGGGGASPGAPPSPPLVGMSGRLVTSRPVGPLLAPGTTSGGSPPRAGSDPLAGLDEKARESLRRGQVEAQRAAAEAEMRRHAEEERGPMPVQQQHHQVAPAASHGAGQGQGMRPHAFAAPGRGQYPQQQQGAYGQGQGYGGAEEVRAPARRSGPVRLAAEPGVLPQGQPAQAQGQGAEGGEDVTILGRTKQPRGPKALFDPNTGRLEEVGGAPKVLAGQAGGGRSKIASGPSMPPFPPVAPLPAPPANGSGNVWAARAATKEAEGEGEREEREARAAAERAAARSTVAAAAARMQAQASRAAASSGRPAAAPGRDARDAGDLEVAERGASAGGQGRPAAPPAEVNSARAAEVQAAAEVRREASRAAREAERAARPPRSRGLRFTRQPGGAIAALDALPPHPLALAPAPAPAPSAPLFTSTSNLSAMAGLLAAAIAPQQQAASLASHSTGGAGLGLDPKASAWAPSAQRFAPAPIPGLGGMPASAPMGDASSWGVGGGSTWGPAPAASLPFGGFGGFGGFGAPDASPYGAFGPDLGGYLPMGPGMGQPSSGAFLGGPLGGAYSMQQMGAAAYGALAAGSFGGGLMGGGGMAGGRGMGGPGPQPGSPLSFLKPAAAVETGRGIEPLQLPPTGHTGGPRGPSGPQQQWGREGAQQGKGAGGRAR